MILRMFLHARTFETVRARRPSWRVVLAVFAGVPLVACSTASAPASYDGTTIESGARSYAEAILLGNARAVNDALSSTCPNQITDAALNALRAFDSAHSGIAFTSLHITSVETRNVTPTTGEAWVHVNLSPELEGNDNWLNYAFEDGHWKVTDCGRLPFGGSSTSGPSTVTGSTGVSSTVTR